MEYAMAVTPEMLPTNIPDLVWYLSTATIVVLIGVVVALIAYFGKRGIITLDEIKIALNTLTVKVAVTDTRLEDHINDSGAHCKGVNCPTIRRECQ